MLDTTTRISAEEYMAEYAEQHFEWVRGRLVKMPAVSLKHDNLTGYLRELIRAYFAFNPIGQVTGDPFVMQLDDSRRQPDLQVILNGNPGQLTDAAMIGPADICIEVVSRASVTTDYGEKFEEYEQAGVGEYWICDPIREQCRFHRLRESGVYALIQTDGAYQTPLLPRFVLETGGLWSDDLPDIVSVVAMVRRMWEGET